jgi:hypothetical protein
MDTESTQGGTGSAKLLLRLVTDCIDVSVAGVQVEARKYWRLAMKFR